MKKMKKKLPTRNVLVSLALTAGIAAPIAALAADLSNGFGSTCDGSGMFHFVNNQVGGATTGTITAEFTCGTFTSGPSKVTGGTIQFLIGTSGSCELLDASTNLPGRLVLSDFTCTPATTTSTTTSTTATPTTTSSTTSTTMP